MKSNRKNRTPLDNLAANAARTLGDAELAGIGGGVWTRVCRQFPTKNDQNMTLVDTQCYYEEV